MALIKCRECQKEISDTAKVCPHCGYKLKNIQKISLNINNTKILSCYLLTLAFISSFFKISFSRDNYSTNRQLLNESFNNIMYYFVDNFDGIYTTLGMIAIISLVYTILKKKTKLKKFFYYIPTFLYTLIALIVACAIMFGGLDMHTPKYDTYYGILWGGIWILIMLSTSSIFLIIDLVKSKKEEIK